MCFVDYGGEMAFYSESSPRARKPYECEDCFAGIRPGESYLKASGKWDGEMFVARRCARCCWDAEVIYQHEISEGCGPSESSVPFGMIDEYFDEHGWARSPITYRGEPVPDEFCYADRGSEE